MQVKLYSHVQKIWLLTLLDKYGNFKEAASHATITQSALSQSISSLENIVGKTLIIRGRGIVKLTDDGDRLVKMGIPILSSIDSLNLNQDEETAFKGKVRLGSYESIAIQLLPGLLAYTRENLPNLKVDLRTSRSGNLIQQVRKGELDMALVIGGHPDNRIDVDHLADEYLAMYVAADKKIAEFGLDALRIFGLGSISPGPDGYPLYLKKFLKELNSEYRITLSSDSFESILSATLAGSLVGILPGRVAKRHSDKLIRIWPEENQISNGKHQINLVSRKNLEQNLVALFKKELTAILTPN